MMHDFVLFNGKDAREGLSDNEAIAFAKKLVSRGWEFRERTNYSMDILFDGKVVGRAISYDK